MPALDSGERPDSRKRPTAPARDPHPRGPGAATAHANCFRRKSQGLLDIPRFEIRIIVKYLGLGHSVGNHGNDRCHRDPQSP
jgi:hypothetical protein